QHGIRGIPDEPLPTDPDGCRAKIHEWLDEKPALFVQLLGPNPWKRLKNSDETVVTLQHRCVVEHAPKIPILKWRDKALAVEGVAHAKLKALLSDPEVRTEPPEAFKAEVRRKAAPPKKASLPREAPASGKSPPAVFVQSDTVDLGEAEHLSELLKNRLKFRSWWPKSSNKPDEQA